MPRPSRWRAPSSPSRRARRAERVLALAALSARALAEAAANEGLRAVALDAFGDADTQRVACEWRAIGEAGSLNINGDRLIDVLSALAERGDVRGWIAGSGFDGRPDLLERGAALLPLIGTAAGDVRRVRDPRLFFAELDRHGIGFPPIRFDRPETPEGWLRKDAGGCGGWQVRRARHGDGGGPGVYWQRERSGTPHSATFIGNGVDAVLLGINRQGVRAIGERPFVFSRIAGPVPVSEAATRELAAIVRLLAGAFRVRGLASLDVLLEGDRLEVLELNPRPPASHGALSARG
ncbi:ATP-grasp domain-containing protein [Piscinibacter aquaticus]|uniref:ATP-grasp domain-containing protein n=1 Tax=Piscinibacter aquaticus TaxID=392597 RepID=A0A5C6TZS6_9BURK|nr:ATP-grasp domain-containing protein [Piscinibacter aquaticus]